MVVFVTINLMLAIIAIVSMTHYLVAIETGGRHLLAFNLSVCICGTIFLRQRYIQDGIVAGTAISGRRAT